MHPPFAAPNCKFQQSSDREKLIQIFHRAPDSSWHFMVWKDFYLWFFLKEALCPKRLKEVSPHIRFHFFTRNKNDNLTFDLEIKFWIWIAHWKERRQKTAIFFWTFWISSSQSKVTAPMSRRPWKKVTQNWSKLWVSHSQFPKARSHTLKCFLRAKNRHVPLWLCSESIAPIKKIRDLLYPGLKTMFSIIQIRIWLNLIRGDTSFNECDIPDQGRRPLFQTDFPPLAGPQKFEPLTLNFQRFATFGFWTTVRSEQSNFLLQGVF